MRIGFANGCFDLFHEGHRHYLTECRKQCDYLIVAVNSDAYCRRVKGADRPYEPLQKRMMHVRAFSECVFPFEGREDPLIMQIRPHLVFKGEEHSPELKDMCIRGIGWKEGAAILKIPVVHICRLPGFSTTLAASGGGNDAPQPDAPGGP